MPKLNWIDDDLLETEVSQLLSIAKAAKENEARFLVKM